MKRLSYYVAAFLLLAFTGIAVADYTIKDGAAATQTIFAFVCATTKICPAHVTINSSGTELGTTSNPFQTGAPASAYADGWDVATGATTATAATAGSTGSVNAKLRYMTTQLDNINTNVAAAVPSGTNTIGSVKQTDGTTVVVTDPCQGSAKTIVPITLATAAVKVIATGVSAKKIYVCAIDLTNNAADSVAVFEATTGTVCATAAVAVVGAGTSVATAATGYNFAANGGISKGQGGFSVWQTTVNNNDLCVAQSAATQLTGTIAYVTQ